MDAQPILDVLPDGYAIHTHHVDECTGQMLDTFEGHLRRTGQLLLQRPKRILLIDLVSGGMLEQEGSPGWQFAEKLLHGEISDRLQQLSKLRAFSTIAAVAVELRDIVLMDELEKTVARARAIIVSQDGRHATWLSLSPLRGYDDELILFANALEESGFSAFESSSDYYPPIGLEQACYTSKPDIVLMQDTSVYDSATEIARTFIGVARLNEEGILADLDTEFLHDFRVSLRRVRSLLSLFRNVYDEQDCRAANKELAGIMKQTNRLRDLDVYLMDRGKFYALVPDSMYAGLQTLFDIFARERQEALEQVGTFLQSDSYKEQMQDLQRRFSEPEGMARGGAANEATGHFAGRMIMKRYGKVGKLARSINRDTPDETVHALRIQCKKLRYLMEFFAPLYSPKAVKSLVKSLKGLQDQLGMFNDCSVQRASLTAFVDEHPLRGKQGLILAESVGALVATLYQMQLRARSEIDAALKTFANDQTNEDFRQLFDQGGSS